MLQLSESFTNRPVMSLRTGDEIATAIAPIINPNNLKIEGWYCLDRFDKKQLILLEQDVRDVLKQGIVVNDYDVLIEPDELVRLKKILDLAFELIDKPVVTINKKRLGKVSDYTVEVETMYIQKIYASKPILKSLSGGGLTIERNQIIEITPHKIVIQDPLQPTKATGPLPATAG